MAETKKIIHIETATISNVSSRQLAVETGADADLGYRMWGGKDGQGVVTKWLAKDRQARVTDLTISGVAGGGTGVLQHNNSGEVSGLASLTAMTDVVVSSPTDDQILQYNATLSRWENVTASFPGNTLDESYDEQSAVERSIYMDDGNVAWYLDSATAQFKIEFTVNGTGNDGFYVNGDGGEYFRVIRFNQEGQLDIRVQSDDVRYDLNCTRFDVISDGVVNISSDGTLSISSTNGSVSLESTNSVASVGTYHSTSDFTLRARGSNITLNESGDTSLSGDFTASSIIGALNELKASDIAFTAPSYTTTERDALTPVNGMIIYNTTTTTIQGYSNGSWQDIGDIT